MSSPLSPDDPELAFLFDTIRLGETPTIAALLVRRPELAQAHGTDGQTPLHAAVQFNDPQLVALFLSYGADPQAKFGQSGHTALSWGVTCNALEGAHALVRLGVRPDLFCAAGLGLLENVRAFFDGSGALLTGAAQTGSSRFAADGSRLPCPPPTAREQVSDALYIACRTGQADVVRFLLGQQPDLSFRAFLGGTPFHWAYFGGSRSVIEQLLSAGADPSARDDVFHCTPRAFGICVPANWGFAFLVRARLADDPLLANLMDGQTSPLHEAARGGSAEVVRLLLAAGADPQLRNSQGETALAIATAAHHASVVDILQPLSSGVP